MKTRKRKKRTRRNPRWNRNPLSPGKRNFINQMLQKAGITDENIIDLAFEADPTDNGSYTQWIVNQVISKNIQLPGDAEYLSKLLMVFNRVKPHLPPQEDGLNLRNISEYQSVEKLKEIVEKYGDLRAKRGGAKEDAVTGQRVVLTHGPFTVIEALTAHAASKLTRDGKAKWCVSSVDTAQEYLDEGPLYFIDKNDKRYVLAHCRGTYCAEYAVSVAHKEDAIARYKDKKCPICGKNNTPGDDEDYKWVVCPEHAHRWNEVVTEHSETCDYGPTTCDIKNTRDSNLSPAVKKEVMPVLRALFSIKADSSLEHIADYLYNFGVKGEDRALKKKLLETQNPERLVDYVIARRMTTRPRKRRQRWRRRARNLPPLIKPDIGKAKPWPQAEKLIFQDPTQASRYYVNVYNNLTVAKRKTLSNKLKKLWGSAGRLAITEKRIPHLPDVWLDPVIYADARAASRGRRYLSGEDDYTATRAKEAARRKLVGLEEKEQAVKKSYARIKNLLQKERKQVALKYIKIKEQQQTRGIRGLDKITKSRKRTISGAEKTNRKLTQAARRTIIDIKNGYDLRTVILRYLRRAQPEGKRTWQPQPYQSRIKEFFFDILRYYEPVSYADNLFETHHELKNQTKESLWEFYQDNARLLRARLKEAAKKAKLAAKKAKLAGDAKLIRKLRKAEQGLARLHDEYDFE